MLEPDHFLTSKEIDEELATVFSSTYTRLVKQQSSDFDVAEVLAAACVAAIKVCELRGVGHHVATRVRDETRRWLPRKTGRRALRITVTFLRAAGDKQYFSWVLSGIEEDRFQTILKRTRSMLKKRRPQPSPTPTIVHRVL